MPIRFPCPNPACGKTIAVKDEAAGRAGKCPACQTPVTVPSAADRKPTPAPATAEPDAEEPAGTGAGSILEKTEWYVRPKQGWLIGTYFAEVLDSTKSDDIHAHVWDARFRLLGLYPVRVPLLRPKRMYHVRTGDRSGPVVLTLAEYPPLLDLLPVGPSLPVRWEVRDDGGQVVGSVVVDRRAVNLLKLAKGQLFQKEHGWLDADGRKVGAVAIERGATGMTGAMVVQGTDGREYASFGTAHGERFHAELEEAKKQKGVKAAWGASALLGDDVGLRGSMGRVHRDRAGDRYARLMTLATTVLMEVIGVDKFMGSVTRSK